MATVAPSDTAFKQSGIIRAGFDYQDLMGIEILIDFYRDPHRYKWVTLESDDKDVGHLDDIVAERADGGIELVQVKFTVDPNRYMLDWDWLLTRKPKGRSLLRKWSLSIERARQAGPICSALLRTNRRPDDAMRGSLRGDHIDVDLLPVSRRDEIIEQAGGVDAAKEFFSLFRVSHSEQMIDDFEFKLKSRIVPTDTDINGWLLLRNQASIWATRRNQPEPDGRIRHEHVVQIITKKRPKPIPQDFQIPTAYCMPSATFHRQFLRRVSGGKSPISILWGSPGKGKSTYLSVSVEELRKAGVPVIRHHYFLSLNDSTPDRISFTDIAASLMDQLSYRYPQAVGSLVNDAIRLREWIETCGVFFKAERKPLVVVVDGLDHVWRESNSIQQLEHLFNQLLPCPENVVLVVGTQRVPDGQLPHRLIQRANASDWVEIPLMDEKAVHAWVNGQRSAGRLRLPEGQTKRDAADHVSKCANAFWKLSLGHPLHLIYSFEALVRRGTVVAPAEIERLPACPDGDIQRYYASLWRTLSAEGRKAIHLIAGAEFQWPADGFRRCAGSVEEVDHLLEHRRAGLMAFHGSILAYARERVDHRAVFGSLLPDVVRWLEMEASEYLRWGWLWLIKAKAGSSIDLLSGATRDWVTQSLARGCSEQQIIAILRGAERAAFDAGDYARTAELRMLKIRVLNGPEYQTNEWERFREVALQASQNEAEIARMADALTTLKDGAVVTLTRACTVGLSDVRRECFDELRARVNIWLTLRHRPGKEFEMLMKHLFEGLARAPEVDVPKVMQFIGGFGDAEKVLTWLIQSLTRQRRLDVLLEVAGQLEGRKNAARRRRVQNALVRVAACEGVDLTLRYRTGRAQVSPLLACWQHIRKSTKRTIPHHASAPTNLVRDRYEYGRNPELEEFFLEAFFNVLASSQNGDASDAIYAARKAVAGDDWLEQAVEALIQAARAIADGKSQLAFSTPYYYSRAIVKVENTGRTSEPGLARYIAFRRALLDIAVHLHHLRCPKGRPAMLRAEEIVFARASGHWVEALWLEFVVDEQWPLLSSDLAVEMIDHAAQDQDRQILSFNERADKWIQLAKLAQLYRSARVSELLLRAASCIVGYGFRKDFFLADVLDSIACVHESRAADGMAWLNKLVPVVDVVTEFTDGDETDHIRSDLIEVAARICPDRLPDFYARHLAKEEYRYAQDALSAHSKLADFSSAPSAALGRTFLEDREVQLLTTNAEKGDQASGAIEAVQLSFLGGTAHIERDSSRTNQEIDTSQPVPDLRRFSASHFRDALDAATHDRAGYAVKDEALSRWLSHWSEAGDGVIALQSIRAYFDEVDNPYPAEGMLDAAFEVSLALEGKEKAYEWLVRAHAHRNGWQSNWTSEDEIMQRLRRAAQLYGDRWRVYIRDTSKPVRYWQKQGEGFSLGFKYLVRFLILCNQNEVAARFTEACVGIVASEVDDQPITKRSWL